MLRNGFYVHDGTRMIPEALRKRPNSWVRFRVSEPDPKRNGKRSKVPCDDNGYPVSMHNKEKLGSYSEDRVGYLLTKEDGVVAIDPDGKPDPEYLSWYRDFIARAKKLTFTEKSVGAHLDGKEDNCHIILYGKLRNGRSSRVCKELSIEIYDSNRFILTTGLSVDDENPCIIIEGPNGKMLLDMLEDKMDEIEATNKLKAQQKLGPLPLETATKHRDPTDDSDITLPSTDSSAGVTGDKGKGDGKVAGVKPHPKLKLLLAQYDWMHANDKEYLPQPYAKWGGFVRRLKTLGATTEEIDSRCKRRPNYDHKRDRIEIRKARPFDDVEKQVKICFAQLLSQGYDRDADLSEFGIKKSKSKKKEKDTDFGDVFVISSQRPVLDYQKCLTDLGFLIRDHAFLGFQWSADGGKSWQPYRAGMQEHIYRLVLEGTTIVTEHGLRPANFTKQHRIEAITDLMYSNKFNPLANYVKRIEDQLVKGEIDPNISQIESLMEEIFGLNVDPKMLTDLTRDDGKKITEGDACAIIPRFFADAVLLAAKGIVSRLWKPGCNFPYFFLIPGTKGCGKSLFIERFLPGEARSGFCDSFDLGLSNKEKDLILRAMALVECSEMVGQSRKAIADQKSMVSSKQSMHRLAYQIFPQQIIRNAVLFGTTNEDECLPSDPDGDRRYIVMPVTMHPGWTSHDVEVNLPKIMDKYRDQLFALAIKELRAGRGCSTRYWAKESLIVRDRLFKKTEKRHIPIEVELEKLVMDYADVPTDKFGDRKWEVLTDDEKTKGIPLTVPSNCDARSIHKLIIGNSQNNSAISKTISAKWLGAKLDDKGWKSLGRKKLSTRQSQKRVDVTLYIPPKSSS